MNTANKEHFFRITALWALSESMLGGLLHGLKIPITGILVGGLAVVYICMLGYYSSSRKDILTATILVMLIKGLLAPHSPFGAYFAVFFQGTMGWLIFSTIPSFRLGAILLGLINLLESALQKLIVTTIVFGKDVWVALDEFISYVLGQFGVSNEQYIWTVLAVYLGIYSLAGLFFGWLGGTVPNKIAQYRIKYPDLIFDSNYIAIDEKINPKPKSKRKKIGKKLIVWIWIILLFLLLMPLINPELELLPQQRIAQLLIRSFLVIAGWLLIIGPMLMKLFKRWMAKKQTDMSKDISQVLGLMPETKWIVKESWNRARIQTKSNQFTYFSKVLLINIFPENEKRNHINRI